MKVLEEISEKTLGRGESEQLGKEYALRKSARAILAKNDGTVAIQYLENHTFHKLPGGGVDPGETIEEALRREIKEEVGCDLTIEKPLGMVIEYRNKYNLIHISYCFAARVDGAIAEPTLEQAEIDEGMKTIWITPEEALGRMEKDVPNKYEGHFILQRERAYLREFLSQQQK